MVAAIDERDRDLGVDSEVLRRIEPAEPAADDDDPVPRRALARRGDRGATSGDGETWASAGAPAPGYLSRSALASAAWAAASRATGTRNGEHDT